jgi:hypothetical protein
MLINRCHRRKTFFIWGFPHLSIHEHVKVLSIRTLLFRLVINSAILLLFSSGYGINYSVESNLFHLSSLRVILLNDTLNDWNWDKLFNLIVYDRYEVDSFSYLVLFVIKFSPKTSIYTLPINNYYFLNAEKYMKYMRNNSK